jgi:hypothetical protein
MNTFSKIFMLFCYFNVFSCTLKIIESNPSKVKIEIKYDLKRPTLLVLKMDSKVYPYLKEVNKISGFEIIEIQEYKKYTNYVFYNKFSLGNQHLVIDCIKLLFKIWQYKWDDERGIKYEFFIITTDGIVHKNKNEIVDIIYVPDFTVHFLAISTCGWAFALVFGIFLKKKILKNKI